MRDISQLLFADLKSDEEKSAFFLSGRAYETGVVASTIQNELAMAYHRIVELKKQLAEAKRNALGSHDVREPTAIGRAVNRAARDLPEGWEIRIDLERGAGVVHLTDPEGNETMIDGSGELFSDQINAAIDAARSAQGESNG